MRTAAYRDTAGKSLARDIEANLHLALYALAPGLFRILGDHRVQRLAIIIGVYGFDTAKREGRRAEDARKQPCR